MATAAKVQPKPGKLFISGKWVDAWSAKTYATVNPATGAAMPYDGGLQAQAAVGAIAYAVARGDRERVRDLVRVDYGGLVV